MDSGWMQFIVSVLAGLVTAIPLVIKLVEYVKKAIKERNWSIILDMVMKYMETAEKKFKNGEDRKKWALAMIETSSETVNYDIDMEVISKLIDNLCKMSKSVNAPTGTAKVGE